VPQSGRIGLAAAFAGENIRLLPSGHPSPNPIAGNVRSPLTGGGAPGRGSRQGAGSRIPPRIKSRACFFSENALNTPRQPWLPERWQSGRSHRTRNAAYGQPYRGFKSLPLRQNWKSAFATRYSDSKFNNNFFERKLKVAATTRNFNTMTKLLTPIKAFISGEALQAWLATNHTKSDGIWLQIFKKDSGTKTITYAEALDVALCYGWIDGQKEKYDENSWLQKFTPRRLKSVWSKRNKEHIARLIKAKKMKPAGFKEIELAKADGRWEQAYDSPSNMKVPEDFLQALAKNKKADLFFKTLNKANTYAIAWRLQTAKKPETRAKRMKVLLGMMARGEKLH
jgi:uncharacterized protein YdeI (YjbR/CyaY-like superfamily)